MKIVTDACCLINLIAGGCIEAVLRLPECRFLVAPVVLEECARHRQVAEREIAAGALGLIASDDVLGDRFLELLDYGLGQGETESIALCEHYSHYTFASDDKRARAVGCELLGEERVTGTLGLLQRAIAADRASAGEAVAWVETMRKAGAYLPPVNEGFFVF